MILVLILAVAAYATLLVRHLTQRLHAAGAGPDDAGSRVPPPTPTPPCCAGNDLADLSDSAWTALDDHQLTRLLKESSS